MIKKNLCFLKLKILTHFIKKLKTFLYFYLQKKAIFSENKNSRKRLILEDLMKSRIFYILSKEL